MWSPDTGIMVSVLWELGCNTDFVLFPWQLTVCRPANRVPATSILLITSADWNRLKGKLLLVIPTFRNGKLFYWAKIVFFKKIFVPFDIFIQTMLKFSCALCKGTLRKSPFLNLIKALHIFFIQYCCFFCPHFSTKACWEWTMASSSCDSESLEDCYDRSSFRLLNHCQSGCGTTLAQTTSPCLGKQRLWAWLCSLSYSPCSKVKLEQPQGCCIALWDQHGPQHCQTEQPSAAAPEELGECRRPQVGEMSIAGQQ